MSFSEDDSFDSDIKDILSDRNDDFVLQEFPTKKQIPMKQIVNLLSHISFLKPIATMKAFQWLSIVFDYIHTKQDDKEHPLSAYYTAIFHFLDQERARPFICHILYRLTTKKSQVTLVRARKLMSIYHSYNPHRIRIARDPHLYLLLFKYHWFHPSLIPFIPAPSIRISKWVESIKNSHQTILPDPPDKSWRTPLEHIASYCRRKCTPNQFASALVKSVATYSTPKANDALDPLIYSPESHEFDNISVKDLLFNPRAQQYFFYLRSKDYNQYTSLIIRFESYLCVTFSQLFETSSTNPAFTFSDTFGMEEEEVFNGSDSNIQTNTNTIGLDPITIKSGRFCNTLLCCTLTDKHVPIGLEKQILSKKPREPLFLQFIRPRPFTQLMDWIDELVSGAISSKDPFHRGHLVFSFNLLLISWGKTLIANSSIYTNGQIGTCHFGYDMLQFSHDETRNNHSHRLEEEEEYMDQNAINATFEAAKQSFSSLSTYILSACHLLSLVPTKDILVSERLYVLRTTLGRIKELLSI